jgi:hypothetical protein
MSGARAARWATGDVQRLCNRAAKSAGGYITVEELHYLRLGTELLLLELLPLAGGDRDRLLQLHHDVLAALAERTVQSTNGGGA